MLCQVFLHCEGFMTQITLKWSCFEVNRTYMTIELRLGEECFCTVLAFVPLDSRVFPLYVLGQSTPVREGYTFTNVTLVLPGIIMYPFDVLGEITF